MGITDWLHPRGKRLTKAGEEIPDPTPIAPPVGYKRQPSLAEQIREMVRSERLRQEVEAAGFETMEEADDFDIPDDPIDPRTPYEAHFDPLPQTPVQNAPASPSLASSEAVKGPEAGPPSGSPEALSPSSPEGS